MTMILSINRKGLCSGWLQLITKHIHSPYLSPDDEIVPLKKVKLTMANLLSYC